MKNYESGNRMQPNILLPRDRYGPSPKEQKMNSPMFNNDLIPLPKFKKVMSEYGRGSLRTRNGQAVNDPKQAEAIAASESGQSYNDQMKKFRNTDRYGIRKK